MISFFKTIIYVPLYNIFISLLNVGWIDAGLATVILTALVKIILYPIARKTSIAQAKLREKGPELSKIREKYKDKQEQAVKTMEFYKTNDINPFSSIITILIQIPVIFSLYYIFFKSGLPNVDTNLLYSFVKAPETVSMHFLGFFDVSQKSIVLAFLAALSSFWQMKINSPAQTNSSDFSSMMANQMKYTMPIVVFFISWKISAIVALYWFVNNLFGIVQDVYIKRQLKHLTLQS